MLSSEACFRKISEIQPEQARTNVPAPGEEKRVLVKRREFLIAALPATMSAAMPATTRMAAEPVKRSPLGVAWTSFMGARRVNDPLELASLAVSFGAAGIQGPMPDLTDSAVSRLRAALEHDGLYFEGASSVPFKESESALFEKQLSAAKAAGARCVRVGCLSGRRYETFHTMAEWREFVARSKDGIRRMVALAERVRLPVAMENHKDWTGDELAALMKEYSSEYLGVCLDFGNNLSLLDDPYEVVEAVAPYTIATHMKDSRVSMSSTAGPKGLLLGDVVLGDGVLDIARILELLRKGGRNPKLSLEMITREALEIPVLSPGYWATFPERQGIQLARVVELGAKRPVEPASLATLSKADRGLLEERNIRRSLDWASANVAWKN
jgi:sugar phosphate isomerase/epimerase